MFLMTSFSWFWVTLSCSFSHLLIFNWYQPDIIVPNHRDWNIYYLPSSIGHILPFVRHLGWKFDHFDPINSWGGQGWITSLIMVSFHLWFQMSWGRDRFLVYWRTFSSSKMLRPKYHKTLSLPSSQAFSFMFCHTLSKNSASGSSPLSQWPSV